MGLYSSVRLFYNQKVASYFQFLPCKFILSIKNPFCRAIVKTYIFAPKEDCKKDI